MGTSFIIFQWALIKEGVRERERVKEGGREREIEREWK
jgi:hypothetical protein